VKRRHHFRLLALATLVWVGFLIAGLPEYYQQYSATFMLVFDLAVLVPITFVIRRVLGRVPSGRRMRVALWIAFYFTVPLAVYDYLYCGLILGAGPGFVLEYWYLTVYYAVPWILAPALVWMIDPGRREDVG
jgi:hypothetical protein